MSVGFGSLASGVDLCFNLSMPIRFYYQNSDCVQRQTKTKAGERKHYYTWSTVGRIERIVDRVYRISSSVVKEAALTPPFHWPFHNPFPSLRTAPSRLRLYGGLMSAEDKHLIYHIINILVTNKQIKILAKWISPKLRTETNIEYKGTV